MKKFSIIVPVYHVDDASLERCIESLITQTYGNIEIILVDDGSTAGNARICDEYASKDPRISVIHQKNNGVSSARNSGLKKATGEFIVFVDADDWLDTTCVEEIERHAEFDMIVFAPRKHFGEKSKNVSFFTGDRALDLSLEGDRIKVFTMEILGSSCMRAYRSRLILTQFDESLKNGEDVFFNYCNVENMKKVYYIDRQLYNYDIHRNSAVRNNNSAIVSEYTKTISKMNNNDANLLSLKYSFSAIALLMLAVHYCFSRNKKYGIGKKDMKKILNLDVYKDLFANFDKVRLPFTRKLSVFVCKLHLYPLIFLISKIKHGIDR